MFLKFLKDGFVFSRVRFFFCLRVIVFFKVFLFSKKESGLGFQRGLILFSVNVSEGFLFEKKGVYFLKWVWVLFFHTEFEILNFSIRFVFVFKSFFSPCFFFFDVIFFSKEFFFLIKVFFVSPKRLFFLLRGWCFFYVVTKTFLFFWVLFSKVFLKSGFFFLWRVLCPKGFFQEFLQRFFQRGLFLFFRSFFSECFFFFHHFFAKFFLQRMFFFKEFVFFKEIFFLRRLSGFVFFFKVRIF